MNNSVDNLLNILGLSTAQGDSAKLLSLCAAWFQGLSAGLSLRQVLAPTNENRLVPTFGPLYYYYQ